MANNKLVTVDVLLHNNKKIKEQLNKKVNIDQGVDNKGKLLGINDLGQVSLVDTPDGATISAENGNIISRKEDGLFAEDTIVEILVDGNTVPIVDKKVDIALKTINDLENYYLKTETYSADEIDDLLSAITTLNILAVDTLPTENISTTTIYLVSNGDTEENNIHDEYICLDSTVPTWEKIGSTKVDLTDYVKSEKLTEELENYVLKVDGKGLSTHDLTDELLEKIIQNDNIIEISKADYDLLTDEEKRDKIYYVYDDENGVLTWNTLSEKPFESIDVESFDISEDGFLSLKGEYVKTDDIKQMFKDEFYISTTTPAHYELTESTTPNALEVVSDGTATDGQIDLSNVADIGANVGDFVLFVDEVTTTDTKYAEKTFVYSKSETDEKIAEAVTSGTADLSSYVKTETLTEELAKYTNTVDSDEKYVLDEEIKVLSESDVLALIGLSDTELEGLNQILVDASIVTNKTWSSSKIYSELSNTLDESKAYTLQELSKAIGASYKVVTSISEMTSDKVLYLLKDTDSGIYNIYIYDTDTSATELIGSFEVSLDDYMTRTELSDTFVKQTDFEPIGTQVTAIMDGTTTVPKAVNSETLGGLSVDKFAKVDDIANIDITTTLTEDTVNDTSVPSSKVVYDELKRNIRHIADYTDDDYDGLDFNNLTEEGIYTFGITNPITNSPNGVTLTYGVLRVTKYFNKNSYFIEQQYTLLNTGIPTLYERRYVEVTNIWGNWYKMTSSTTVADTDLTSIDFQTETYNKYGNTDNNNWYKVTNGICYLQLDILCNSSTNNSFTALTEGLPIPLGSGGVAYTLGRANGNGLEQGEKMLLISVNSSGRLTVSGGYETGRYISVFSYPVKES